MPDVRLLVVLALLLGACMTNVNVPPATKAPAQAALYTMPQPLPTTGDDLSWPVGQERGSDICAADYAQIQWTLDAPEEGTASLQYARQGQPFSPRYAATFDVQPGQQTYTVNTRRLIDWRGVFNGLRTAAPPGAETLALRLVREQPGPSLCAPRPVVRGDDDFVFDFRDDDTYYINILDYEITDDNGVRLQPDDDPHITNGTLQLCADDYDQVVITMRVEETLRGERLQFFYALGFGRFNQRQSYVLPVVADGEFHDYVVPVGVLGDWRGTIGGLRLDPVSTSGGWVEVRDFRLMRSPNAPPNRADTENRGRLCGG